MLITRGWHDLSRQKEQGEKGKGTIALPAKWHVEELKNLHKKRLLKSLNPQELSDCGLDLGQNKERVDRKKSSFSQSNFCFQNLLPFWQTTWQEQRQTGVMPLVYTHQTKTQTKLIKGQRVPLPQLPFWFAGCLCVWAISVCGLDTIMLLPKLHGNSQTNKNVCPHSKSRLVLLTLLILKPKADKS